MRNYSRANHWTRLLLILLFLWPLICLFLLPVGPIMAIWWFWILGLFSAFLIWMLLGRPADSDHPASRPALSIPLPNQPAAAFDRPEAVKAVMDIRDAAELPGGIQVFRGDLREPAESAYEHLSGGLTTATVPLLQKDEKGTSTIILMPREVEQQVMERRPQVWINWLLLILTLATTTFAGAAHQGVNLLKEPGRFAVGLPYALALMAILGCHELGHYFTARHHRMNVTPPYFIPVPFALGTFGAFIQMRSPSRNRSMLFDVAVAGPLAGLVIAIPALYFGLLHSAILSPTATSLDGAHSSLIESSMLLSAIMHFALGDAADAGSAVRLSPLAFAGWLGLLITALNLLPIGQLDGGHIARAMFGTRTGTYISWTAMTLLFLLAIFVWPGLMTWAILVYFMSGRPSPPLNDVTTLTSGRFVLGLIAFLILLVILLPAKFLNAVTMHCPYL